MSRRNLIRAAGAVVALAVIGLLPLFVGEFRSIELARVGIYVIALLGLNILTGYTGQISLGHGAFMGIGAYTTAIVVTEFATTEFGGAATVFGIPATFLTIPLGGVVAGVVGFLFGFPALRLAGVYLALATFALAIALPSAAKRFEGITGGGAGLLLDLPPDSRVFYYVTWSIAVVLFVVAWLLVRGRTGRALRAVRENELAAVSSGVSLASYKTFAFGVSAFYAGIAGSLLAIEIAFVNPDTFPIALSILLLTGLVVGGLGALSGVLIGALFIQFVPLNAPIWLNEILGWVGVELDETAPGLPAVIYGIVLLLVLLLVPRGAAGLLHRGAKFLRFS